MDKIMLGAATVEQRLNFLVDHGRFKGIEKQGDNKFKITVAVSDGVNIRNKSCIETKDFVINWALRELKLVD